MKIFGYEIKKEKRSLVEPTLTYNNDALVFSQIFNNYSAMNVSACFRAVEIISDSIAILPIQVRLKNGTKSESIDSHSLNTVFKDNLGNLTKYNFMKLLIQSVLLNGNGYCYIERNIDGSVKSLKYLRSADVQVYHNKDKNTTTYSCKAVSNKRIESCDMIHLIKNTVDGVNGVSVLSYASRSLKLSNNTENAASSFFDNGMNLSGILTVNGPLSAQQRKDIQTSWRTAYNDGGNGLAILPGSMSFQSIQQNSKDSQLLESRLFNVQDIARFFGISPVLLGDLSHSSYNTIEAMQQDFVLHTLQPYITMVESEFTNKLLKPSESDLEINLDEKFLLRTDKNATASYYSTLLANGILSINEVRKELGYSEIENGDRHIIPFTDISQNTIEKEPENDSTKKENKQ